MKTTITTINQPVSDNYDIEIKQGAEEAHIFFIDNKAEGEIKIERTVSVGDNAKADLYYCFLGGDTDIKLHTKIGSNARVNHRVIFLQTEKQKLSVDDQYQFQGTNSYGRFDIKGLVADKAQSNYVGNIIIDPGAQKTDSRLDMQSLIDGGRAKSIMVPSLKIEANDVKAGHSATISQLDEEQLFYTRSRGLSVEQARRLLVEGLFNEFVNSLPDDKVKKEIKKQLDDKYLSRA